MASLRVCAHQVGGHMTNGERGVETTADNISEMSLGSLSQCERRCDLGDRALARRHDAGHAGGRRGRLLQALPGAPPCGAEPGNPSSPAFSSSLKTLSSL